MTRRSWMAQTAARRTGAGPHVDRSERREQSTRRQLRERVLAEHLGADLGADDSSTDDNLSTHPLTTV